MLQRTIKSIANYSGIGLHSGKVITLKLQPAPVNSGITFFIHTPSGIKPIKPTPSCVVATSLATTLASCDSHNTHVSTVEHLLATLRGLAIDNIACHVMGNEIPILDGSAAPFVKLLLDTGIVEQHDFRKIAKIYQTISCAGKGKAILAQPYDGFFVDYTIDFPHPSIGVQRLAMEITPETFSEIAYARTFGFLKEVEYLHSRNLALGGNLDNAVVLDDEKVLNPEGLRSSDEFVRHKMLDFVGDLAMFGMPLHGHFTVACSGHEHNNTFVRKLEENAAKYINIVSLKPKMETFSFPSFSAAAVA